MAIPLLDYSLTSQNQRVQGFEVTGDEQPRVFSTEDLRSSAEMDNLIQAAYLQIFREQQMLQHNRQTVLESQLRNGQITVREFIRGLVLSDPFRTYTYNSNSNYRVVELCVQRLLGRDVHGERETQAWSIVLATKGLEGFLSALLNSKEYDENFGDDIVPYQRRRILPQRSSGEVTHQHMPRYTAEYRERLEQMGLLARGGMAEGYTSLFSETWPDGLPPKSVRVIGGFITLAGALGLSSMFVAVALAAFGVISL